ncbi:MAG: TolC family protein [Gemmatimonadales bacterium]
MLAATLLLGLGALGGVGNREPAQERGTTLSQPGDSLAVLVQRVHPALVVLRAKAQAATGRIAAAADVQPAVFSLEVEDVPGGGRFWAANQLRSAIEGEVFGGGRRSARRDQATSEANTEQARLRAAEHAAAAATKARSVTWLAGMATARRLLVEDSLLAAAEEALTARFGAGAATYVEVLRVRAERLRVQTDRAAAIADAGEARVLLLGWLSGDSSAMRSGASVLDSLAAVPIADFDAANLPATPAVDTTGASEAVAGIAASLSREGAARSRLGIALVRPTALGAVGVQQFQSAIGRRVFGATLGLKVSLPFTAQSHNRASIRAARLDADALAVQGTALLGSWARELSVLRVRYEAERARAQVYQSSLLADLRGEREAALAAYRNGALGLFELLDFERTLVRAEIDQIHSVRNALITWHRLAAGIPTILAEELGLGGNP